MEWADTFPQDKQPTFDQIESFVHNDLWSQFNTTIQELYNVKPKMTYSSCSGQPGWNVKYAKSGKSLCTLYPMDGYFIVLVVIGNKETEGAEELVTSSTPYIRGLYEGVPFTAGGRWLMIDVTNESILEDAIELIKLRVRPKSKA